MQEPIQVCDDSSTSEFCFGNGTGGLSRLAPSTYMCEPNRTLDDASHGQPIESSSDDGKPLCIVKPQLGGGHLIAVLAVFFLIVSIMGGVRCVTTAHMISSSSPPMSYPHFSSLPSMEMVFPAPFFEHQSYKEDQMIGSDANEQWPPESESLTDDGNEAAETTALSVVHSFNIGFRLELPADFLLDLKTLSFDQLRQRPPPKRNLTSDPPFSAISDVNVDISLPETDINTSLIRELNNTQPEVQPTAAAIVEHYNVSPNIVQSLEFNTVSQTTNHEKDSQAATPQYCLPSEAPHFDSMANEVVNNFCRTDYNDTWRYTLGHLEVRQKPYKKTSTLHTFRWLASALFIALPYVPFRKGSFFEFLSSAKLYIENFLCFLFPSVSTNSNCISESDTLPFEIATEDDSTRMIEDDSKTMQKQCTENYSTSMLEDDPEYKTSDDTYFQSAPSKDPPDQVDPELSSSQQMTSAEGNSSCYTPSVLAASAIGVTIAVCALKNKCKVNREELQDPHDVAAVQPEPEGNEPPIDREPPDRDTDSPLHDSNLHFKYVPPDTPSDLYNSEYSSKISASVSVDNADCKSPVVHGLTGYPFQLTDRGGGGGGEPNRENEANPPEAPPNPAPNPTPADNNQTQADLELEQHDIPIPIPKHPPEPVPLYVAPRVMPKPFVAFSQPESDDLAVITPDPQVPPLMYPWEHGHTPTLLRAECHPVQN